MNRNGHRLIALVLLVGIVVIAVFASLLFYRNGKAQLPWRPDEPTNWQDSNQVFALQDERPEELLDEPPEELAA